MYFSDGVTSGMKARNTCYTEHGFRSFLCRVALSPWHQNAVEMWARELSIKYAYMRMRGQSIERRDLGRRVPDEMQSMVSATVV